jgi:tryptophan-rich sensory protein
MIRAWMVIGAVAIAVAAIGSSIIPTKGAKWFRRLQRPSWLTFEAAIPVIWTIVFIGGAWSAYLVWQQNPDTLQTWLLMGLYLLLEIITVTYSPVMLWTQNLRIGTIIGGIGFVLCLILAILVFPISIWATVLLLPYLIWSPVGTYTTWRMEQLNPDPHVS